MPLAQAWATALVPPPAVPAATTIRSAASGACLAMPPASTTNAWVRWLAGGDVALLLFNTGAAPASVTCDAACFAAIGGPPAWTARDVLARADAGIITAAQGFTSAALPARGGSLLLRLTPM